MNRLIGPIVTVLLVGLLLDAAGAQQVSVARVIDGNTVEIAGGQAVRLVDFTAAASQAAGGKCAAEWGLAPKATSRLSELVAKGTTLTLVNCSCPAGTQGTPSCNEGRLCGKLTYSGEEASELMIHEGLAAPYICGVRSCAPSRHPWCG